MDPGQVMRFPGARACALLAILDPEPLAALLHAATVARFSPRDTISSRHAPDDALHVIVRGAGVQRSWPSDDTREYVVRPFGEGQVVGLTDVLGVDAPRRETRSLGRALTVRIPGPAVRGLLESSHVVSVAIVRESVLELRTAEQDLLVLGTGDAMARVTHRLVELSRRWGVPGDRGLDVDLPLTQEQLGAWAGVSRETTVKCLQWLRRQGVITTARRHIVVRDLPTLEALTGATTDSVAVTGTRVGARPDGQDVPRRRAGDGRLG